MKYSRQVIKARRRKVIGLWLAGKTLDEMSTELGFPQKTIWRDVVWIKKESDLNITKDERVSELYLQIMGRTTEMAKKAYEAYLKAIATKEVMLLKLKETLDEDEERLVKLQLRSAEYDINHNMSIMKDFDKQLFDNLIKVGAIKAEPVRIETKNLNLTMDMTDFGDLYDRYEKARTTNAPLDGTSRKG